jgi:Toprim-like
VQEIQYIRDGNAYFALAFKNDSGGYELRNPYFKGTHGPKDITLLPGQATPPLRLAVFEGFIDFLSAVASGCVQHSRQMVLVLNSNALREKALAVIRERGAATVELYLDHDPSGRNLTAYFRRELAGVDVVDRSDLYAGHKDVNDFLTTRKQAASR